jgi:hypothetical protein
VQFLSVHLRYILIKMKARFVVGLGLCNYIMDLFHLNSYCQTLAERFPEGHIPMFYRNFDEFYLAFDSLVQWHYFLTRG